MRFLARPWPRPAAVMLLLASWWTAAPVRAGEYELGMENFFYRSRSTLLNRDNVLGLSPTENLFRLTGAGRASRGAFAIKASAFVEQQVMRLRPGAAVVETDLQRVMRASHLRTRVGEQQHVFLLAAGLVVDSQQAAVAVRLDQRVATGWMGLPRLAAIVASIDGPGAAGIGDVRVRQRKLDRINVLVKYDLPP